ncbi:hypothetical protein [Mycolicibacterium smegmatis]|uniref:hypothetical protein n=1 Tax=Mycolicibacterium smegmatis TaxID=1772 RepID=UPI0005D97C18|nr:hypothetical protein [Mycolicibacterium smegmatis]MDF1902903.1 hypothetical protein [Mycolicibacterium smegmatis]MDF1909441.1 hypothetical protein [Mycolicibacterium smegmatis]MDF1921557.1 hypothetical protein [Mycolicibacterium smegmatis]MDF1927701.1 hypothetical protein [Mycolicibacterium smegmatis]UAK52418.1 hypothetical protein K8P01_17230 [Mycolicibacterium smegmatis]
MADHNTPFSSSDDDWGDDSAAFDSAPDASELGVFGEYLPTAGDADSSLDALDAVASAPISEVDEPDPGPLFSATNPPGTITVTAYLSGWLQRIDLAPSVVNMTESQLAREIADLAQIATKKAGAGQYVFLLYSTVQQVGDSPGVRSMLKETLGLPTPEEAAEAEAAYTARYTRERN